MAITYFGATSSPADNGTSTATQITLTPPASMQAGDLVYVQCWQRGTATFSVGVDGGQTWNSLTRSTGTNIAHQAFWCRFDGTWDANPRFDFSAGTNTNAFMVVFRPSDTGKEWAVDTAESNGSFTAGTTPFTKTITGRTPNNDSNVSIASWITADDNTWGSLSGTNWTKASLSAQYRNTSGSDMSATFAYQIQTTAAATNNVSQNQATFGGDAGRTSIITFYEKITTTKTQTGVARITATTIKTQTGKAAIRNTTTKTQTGVAKIELPTVFPATSILDDFNRSDEDPLAGGWSSGPLWYGDPLHKLVSNQATAATGGTFHDAVWGTTFAADQEIYVTVATVTNLTSIALYARLTGENTSGYTNAYFYADFNNSTGNVSLEHYDGSSTVLDTANISGGLASGDSIGMSCIGTAIKVYHKPSGGSWTEICSATSSAQNVSGKLGITTDSGLGLYRLDDFGGGEVSGNTTTTKTQTGISRIRVTTTKTQTGISKVQATTTRTQTGVAKISSDTVTTKTQTGVANIRATTTRTQTGIAAIRATTTRTQTGVANVVYVTTTTKTQTGKARIVGSNAYVNVITSSSLQTISGWEGVAQMGQLEYPATCSNYEAKVLEAVEDLGINRIRVEILSGLAENSTDYYGLFIANNEDVVDNDNPTEWADVRANRRVPVNDNADPNSINTSGFQWSYLDRQIDTVILPLKARLSAKGETLLWHVTYVHFSASNQLHVDTPAEYGELMLAVWQHLDSTYGFVPDGIEIFLEPDNIQLVTAAETASMINAAYDRITGAGFAAPYIIGASTTTSIDTRQYYLDIKTASATAASRITEVARHRYGTVPDDTVLTDLRSTLEADGKIGSQLESGAGVGSGGNSIEGLYKDIAVARASAWAQFTLAYRSLGGAVTDDGNQYFLIGDSPNYDITVGNRTKYLRHYMKYIRGGAVSKETVNSSSNYLGLGFLNPNGKCVVVIKCATNGTIDVLGLPAGTYGIRYTLGDGTSAPSAYDQVISNQTVATDGGTVSFTMSGAGVVTVFELGYAPNARTQTGVARIRVATTKTQTGVSRIRVTTTKTQTGRASIVTNTVSTHTQTGVSRIQITASQTQTGKSAIRNTTTKTQTGVSRILYTIAEVQQGVARVQKVVSVTQTGKSRIQFTATETQSGKSRLQVTNSELQTGVSKIQNTTVRTQLGKSAVRNTTTKTQTGQSRIQYVNQELQTGVSRILIRVTETQTGVSRIQLVNTETQTGVTRIQNTTADTQSGVTRIQKTVTQTQTGLAKIVVTGSASQTQNGKANIRNTTTQTQSGVARIQLTTVETQIGQSRIQSVVAEEQLGKSAIQNTTVKTQSGLSRITIVSTHTITGKSKITNTTLRTVDGAARIRVTVPVTQTGKSSVRNTTLRTQSGKSSIRNTTVELQTGLARVTNTSSDTQTGQSRIQITTTKTQTGAGRIQVTTTQIQTGVAKITVPGSGTESITGKASIYGTTTRIQTGTARIGLTNTETQTGVSRIQVLRYDTVNGTSRIQTTVSEQTTGVTRIRTTVTQTQSGVAKILVQGTVTKTVSGKAAIRNTTVQAQTGVARISLVNTETQLGVTRITVTQQQLQTGVSRIRTVATQAQSGTARITSKVLYTQTGLARIQISTIQVISGKANIVYSSTQNITGRTNIIGVTQQTILGKARIALLQRRIYNV